MSHPNLFLVGAPKSGTTAMHRYLAAHPELYMAPKELHFFGTDLTFRFTPRLELEEYLAFFAASGHATWVGDASVRYLQSVRAAEEIRDFAPDSRILVMLRHPVDMMWAMHGELVFLGMEDIADFRGALDAEDARHRGERVPAGANVPQMLLYRTSARYAEQLERYLTIFGRDRVHVIIYDDFAANPSAAYRATLQFLGASDDFEPSFDIVNQSKEPRSRWLRRFLATPPAPVRALARAALPRHLRKRAYQAGHRLNARPARRTPVDPVLRAQLVEEFRPQVEALEQLLGRQLTTWKRA